ncbi:NAD-dependent epimerase/dehydratase family protein [Bradyrhizobium jicamae]|uniref:NAD-dependent epimerase/dehydratase family protein n=1 Tax=Bradyrhizobium jicamae TaxID=280332 RepID=A0ABS5FN71_9BRAD|nr:NAD-dependent epimerase/dehydratase family protein [Bradyrhizobium jicamae]MBR0798223.1 NAD-dependent epimerase/dehydratase family protein [Bradyrhizobium jicamae]
MKNSKPLVLVTGASGFVGRHIVPLLKQEGWDVRSAVRRRSGEGDEVVINSLGPTTNWSTALADVDAVVHLAARVHHQREEQAVKTYHDVNIAGTLHLARSAVSNGVSRFIFVSTVLVHGRSNDGHVPFRENDVLTPRGLYGMSKAAAEAGLRNIAEDCAMCVTVIRPPLVYGSGAKGNFAMLVRALKQGVPLPFAGINNHRAFLAVQNLASFILQRLQKADKNFDVFLVADEEQVSTSEFIERLAEAAGIRSRQFRVPAPILSALLRMSGRQEMRDSLMGSLVLDVSKAAATGWQPPVSLDCGLRLALDDSKM